MPEPKPVDRRLEEYWDWVAVGLFLLLTVDLLTSLYAAESVGRAQEANPVMAWLLGQSLAVLVAVHLLAAVLAAVFFYGVFELIRDTAPRVRRVMMRGVEVYLGALVAAGLFVFANNVSVIVLGRGLL